MDKQEYKEFWVSSALESVVSIGEDGISSGREENLARARDCGSQGQREESFTVKIVVDEGAFSNGDDIIVEVTNSEVFAYGICRPVDENLKVEGNRDVLASKNRELERDVKSL